MAATRPGSGGPGGAACAGDGTGIGWRWRCVLWVSKASEHDRGCSLFGRLTVRILLRRVLLESDELLVHQAKKQMTSVAHHCHPATRSPCPVVGPRARSGTNSQQGRLHYFLPLVQLAQRAAPSASACQLVRKSASQPAMEISRRTAVREILDNRQRRAAACQPSGPGSGLWVRCGRALPGQFGSRVVSRIVFASQTQTTRTRR